MACIPLQCLSLTTNLMAFHMVTLFLCVQCFAANAKNDTAISWNLSALSIGMILTYFQQIRIFLKKLPFVPVRDLLDIDGDHLRVKPLLFF